MPQEELTGLTGWAAGVVDRLGELGLLLLVAVENVFPPIPSEPVLTLAGVLAAQGRLSLTLVVLGSTAGSVLGALLLYEVGARVGRDRLVGLLRRLPLVGADDLERAEAWFGRHGQRAVLLGRLVPVVRSLVSVPAGASALPRWRFALLTALGSGTWNGLFIALGATAGRTVPLRTLSAYVDAGVYVGTALLAVLGLVRWRARRRAGRGS